MRTHQLTSFLSKSRLRSELLSLFCLNSGSSYFLRELTRKLKVSPGALARELKGLSEEGILLKEPRGRQIFYQINRKHSLFNEIKGIVEKTAGIPKIFAEELRVMKEIQQAYLYGSVVTGQMNSDSDIDVLLVGKQTDDLLKLIDDLENKFGRTINFVVYSEKEFNRKRKDKSEFLFQLMKSPLHQLKPAT